MVKLGETIMSPRAQVRRLMSDVDIAAGNAEQALRRFQRNSHLDAGRAETPVATPLRAGLILVSLALAAKSLIIQD